jgi:hypothetical protein
MNQKSKIKKNIRANNLMELYWLLENAITDDHKKGLTSII